MKILLVLTCSACPEQYDAFLGNRMVGYLRLRHGHFRVDFPECGGETIYEATTEGDGSFTEAERDRYLREAVEAIRNRLLKEANDTILSFVEDERGYEIGDYPEGYEN